MRRRGSNQGYRNETVEYWMSFSDLMAGLLLVFILLLVATLFFFKRDLEQREEQVRVAETELEETRENLEELNVDVAEILGVRAKIIERLKERFEESGGQIHFDDATGAVRLGSSILYSEGSARLTRRGRRTLRKFVPLYYDALLGDPALRKHVGQILFEGHTNTNFSGTSSREDAYLYNLKLSQARAYEAMEYVVENDIGDKYRAEELLAANGYSSSRLVYRSDGKTEDKGRSRRLEIRFRLKDEEALQHLREILERLDNEEAIDAR